MHPAIRRVEWDSAVFGRDCYEITAAEEDALRAAASSPGHYAVKVEPLADKAALHRHGFYYVDTLLEPHCRREGFAGHHDARARCVRGEKLDELLAVCHGVFEHGRFHRDFNLPRDGADLRYDNWLRQVHAAGDAYGLRYDGALAGFVAVTGNRLVLHAMAPAFRGRGLAKYLWTAIIDALFAQGHDEVSSSISASNVAAANLYQSLGFRWRHPLDVYHRWTP
ncbi:MAG: GNAT family N-acetyltransferase [Betaproteobacteria bacterium]|nr:GNAT family N-acetyltransferase [Betaproteobacteria bacterium]